MPEETLVNAAKASIVAYNDKNWDAVRDVVTPGLVYDEVSTARKVQGVDEVIKVWKGWATAFPDSKATFENTHVSGNTVIFELTWRGSQTGPLQTPAGETPATGRRIELRACQIIEVAGGKAQRIRHYFDMATLTAQLSASARAAGA